MLAFRIEDRSRKETVPITNVQLLMTFKIYNFNENYNFFLDFPLFSNFELEGHFCAQFSGQYFIKNKLKKLTSNFPDNLAHF